MATAANSMMREKIAINDDNFFITDGGVTTNYVKFAVSSLSGNRTITIPDSNVTIGSATSIAANNVDTGDTGTNCSFVSAGSGNVTVGSGGSGNTTLGSSSSGTTTIRDPTGSILMSSGAITTSSLTTVDLDCSGAMSLNSTSTGSDAINIGNDTNTGGINIGSGASARAIVLGNTDSTTDVDINSGSGGITLNGNGGDIDFQRSGTSEVKLQSASMTLKANGAYTITHAADSVDDDLTISQTGTNDSSLLLTSAGNGTDAIGLSCDNGGITIQSASATGASRNLFGTKIEGTRMFKVNSTGITAAETYTFTPTGSAANVFYVEVRVSVEDNATIGNSGAIVLKGSFTITAAGTVAKLGDSTESFGANLAATATFGISGSTFTVVFTPDGSVNTDFIGTISINTADDGLKLTSIA